jgi:hypothetical protein
LENIEIILGNIKQIVTKHVKHVEKHVEKITWQHTGKQKSKLLKKTCKTCRENMWKNEKNAMGQV